jgi:Xaa-Pro aminopeptidase
MPLHDLRSVRPFLVSQRSVKTPEEIAHMRHAIDITAAGIAMARQTLGSAQYEYHLEAELTAEFIRRGSTHAFLPIVASGRSTTVIHHMKNNQPVAPGDLVLFDVGAESSLYCADISRTYAVGGRFTKRQRAVYEAVQRVQATAIARLHPGITLPAFEEAVASHIVDELKQLGIQDPDVRTYFPHATSHYLGLDVHDVGDYTAPLAPGMVITVEPGIYLKEEGIGVRLEDDVLITKDGHENLSAHIPGADL